MSGLEVAAISLGTSVVQSAVKLWLGDKALAADIAKDGIDALSRKASSLAQQRATRRLGERMAEAVAAKIEPFVRGEIGSIPENEWLAALDLVRLTFEQAAFTDDDLFAADLDAAYLDRHLPDLSRDLSTPAQGLYLRLRRECCAFLVQTARSLPTFQPGALTEMLRRETAVIEHLEEVLARLPEAPQVDFELDYRRQVGLTLDHMELFGATLTEASRRYPLRLAYVELALTDDSGEVPSDRHSTEVIIGAHSRLLIRGDAGGGKTTLLRWIAVRAARGDLPPGMAALHGYVPFLIPLRHFLGDRLPSPEGFLAHVGRHIADEMPRGWVQRMMRSGEAVVLVDGVDEVPEAKRPETRQWLRDLIAAFPDARYVVTSRPGAIDASWLDGDGFVPYELQPMSAPMVEQCVAQWYQAVIAQLVSREERAEVARLGKELAETIRQRRHLRVIASSPLLCALLCALHRDRRGMLPRNRMEVYAIALDMLLERRGADQGLVVDTVMSKTIKMLLLQDVAYWLVRNGKADADRSEVIERLGGRSRSMPELQTDGEDTYRHLLERSGLLREPVVGKVDFVHRTFQEYLAALEAVVQNDIGLLVTNAHRDEWREIVIMAVGHAHTPVRQKILKALLGRADTDTVHRDDLTLVAMACLETSPELPADLRQAIRQRVRTLVPPKNVTVAKAVAATGEWVLDLLQMVEPEDAQQTVAIIRAATEIGSSQALDLIARYRDDRRRVVRNELTRAFEAFSHEEHVGRLVAESFLDEEHVYVHRNETALLLRHFVRMRHLDVTVNEMNDLGFIRDLPPLESLVLSGDLSPFDLSPLSASAYESLEIRHRPKRDGTSDLLLPAVRNGWLEGVHALPNLRILSLEFHGDDVDVDRLSGTPLTRLTLGGIGPGSRFGPETVLDELTELDLRDIQGMERLPDLRAPSLRTLILTRCRSLADLQGIAAWPTLSTLVIWNCPVRDLRPLAELPELSSLRLVMTKVSDLRPLRECPSLRSVEVSKAIDKTQLGGTSIRVRRVRGH